MNKSNFIYLNAIAGATAINVGISLAYPTSVLSPAASMGATFLAFGYSLGFNKMLGAAEEKTVAAALLGASMLPVVASIFDAMYWTTAFALTLGIGITAQAIKDTEFGKIKLVNDSMVQSIEQKEAVRAEAGMARAR